MQLEAEDIEKLKVYELETDNDIYNIIRNYDINKLFNKLIVPASTKEQLKANLKQALNDKNNNEAFRILNYILKYKHNFYKRNDILLDDNSPSSIDKTITLKDSGIYEFILEGASQKSIWYSDINKNFEHFLVKGSPWMDSINLNTDECSRYLYLLKNFNYLFADKQDENWKVYFGNYELNEKGCFLFKKYEADISFEDFSIILANNFSTSNASENINNKPYDMLETFISSFLEDRQFKPTSDNSILEYFEYKSSAFAAYGSRNLFLERFKSLMYSNINLNHQAFLKGSGSGTNDKDLISIKDNIIFDEVKEWVNSEDKSYEKRDYYTDFVQTTNLSPTGESSYLSKIVSLDGNSEVSYLLKSYTDDENSSLRIRGETETAYKPSPLAVEQFDRNATLSETEDHSHIGLIYGYDYDEAGLNAANNDNFIGGGKKGYGPHMSHQDVCYWTNGDDAQLKIRYLGDKDSIMKRVFFQSDSHVAGRRISLKGEESAIENFEYVDVPSGSIIEFKYKCSRINKSLDFSKCYVSVLRNNFSVYDGEYGKYGYEKELDSKSILVNKLMSKLGFIGENPLFDDADLSTKISLQSIYDNINTKLERWTMSDLFFNNAGFVDDSESFLSFNIDKDWNYYTISFRVFDNMILDFGVIDDEVSYYNNVSLDDLTTCNEVKSNKEYFNKSNIHGTDFIKELTFEESLQDRIIDDNLNTLYNKNYYNTVSFDSDESSGTKIITKINDTERELEERLDLYHDYKIISDTFEKVYITIKSGNQVDLKTINRNVPFGDYELEKQGYINNFYFKRTFYSEEELYTKRISVKQGEFLYFKCVYNSCRVEIDRELSSFPEDTIVYPINYDPFTDNYYSINPAEYEEDEDNLGYEKGSNGTTFQWIRFTTSNSSYDIIVFLKKLTVEISFLSNLFGKNIITKNYTSDLKEPNETFSFYVNLPKNCYISSYEYSDKMTYSYAEEEKALNKAYFTDGCYESFISFFDGNSKKVIKTFKDYIFDLPNALDIYQGSRELYEVFKSTFYAIDKKVQYFNDDDIIFSLTAKYSDSCIRISEDYIVGSQVFENFTGSHSNRLLSNGFYRFVSNAGNSGNGGNGGNIVPRTIYATIISGAGGGGLYGGDSGNPHTNSVVSPVDRVHTIFTFFFRFRIGFYLDWGVNIWKWHIGFTFDFDIINITLPSNMDVKKDNGEVVGPYSFGGWYTEEPLDPKYGTDRFAAKTEESLGTLGLTMFMGVGSGQGGNGFYKAGTTGGDGSWWMGSIFDRLKDFSKKPLKDDQLLEDTDWSLNSVFSNNLIQKDFTKQKQYFIKSFASDSQISPQGQLIGVNYLENYLNERYRGAFFDAIINVKSSSNNKIVINSKIGSTGKNGIPGSSSILKDGGLFISLPKDGICGSEGKPTTFELDTKSTFSVVMSSYFTNIKPIIISNSNSVSLNKCLLCAGVHDVSPQKSFDIPDNWVYNGRSVCEYLSDTINRNNGRIKMYRFGGHNNLDSEGTTMDKRYWQTFPSHEFQEGSKYNNQHTVPEEIATFGSFAYINFLWFWLQIDMGLSLDTKVLAPDWKFPIYFDITKGFDYLKNKRDSPNCPVKYRPKLLPLAWDTMSHTIYSVSAGNSRLSKDDVVDDKFFNYDPQAYLEIDNNSHYQAEYPFSWQDTAYVPQDSLNSLFSDVSISGASEPGGDRYTANYKKYLYNYIDCYKNFKQSSAVWNNTYNIYKNNTLCVSNIGLTQEISDSGGITNGRLLNLSHTSFGMPDNANETQVTLDCSYLDVKDSLLYSSNFYIGNINIDLPIIGTDSSIVSALKNLFGKNKKVSLLNENFSTIVTDTTSKVLYSSEAFTNSEYKNNKFYTSYISPSTKIIFKNKDSILGMYKLTKSKSNKYTSTKIGDFSSKKFLFTILDGNGEAIYNSYSKNVVFSMDFTKDNYSLLCSYEYLLLSKDDDFYIIIYDLRNTLLSSITKNPLATNDPCKLNYNLEYPSSRGRIPFINDCIFEMTYLGRDPDSLSAADKAAHKIAYVYSGALYEDGNDSLKERTINYNNLDTIDETSDYTVLIDYQNICNGNAMLNSSHTEWLKI